MVGIRAVTALVGLASLGLVSAASAAPVTFAYTGEAGFSWTNEGNGTSVLNTSTANGDLVNFNYYKVSGLAPDLSGTLSALETINGGAGVTTTGAAVNAFGTLLQPISSALTISYTLVTPIDGLTNLLTITINPVTSGAVLSGQNGGTGGTLSASYPTTPITYTETFSSSFINVASLQDPIAASLALSALDPMMSIGADSQLSSFTADGVGTFSSATTPVAVPEPASLAVLAAGLIGLGFVVRRRGASAAA